MSSWWSSRKPLRSPGGWPRRRWAAGAVLVAPLAALYVSAGGGDAWALPVAVVTAVLAALLLASYLPLPGSGARLEVGCTPCAAISWAAVPGSMMMRSLDPGDLGIALVAAGMVAFGLGQRLAGATSCPTPR